MEQSIGIQIANMGMFLILRVDLSHREFLILVRE
jgi:hypothetical protein